MSWSLPPWTTGQPPACALTLRNSPKAAVTGASSGSIACEHSPAMSAFASGVENRLAEMRRRRKSVEAESRHRERVARRRSQWREHRRREARPRHSTSAVNSRRYARPSTPSVAAVCVDRSLNARRTHRRRAGGPSRPRASTASRRREPRGMLERTARSPPSIGWWNRRRDGNPAASVPRVRQPPPGSRRAFEDLDREAGARERQRRGQPVRSRSDDDGVERRARRAHSSSTVRCVASVTLGCAAESRRQCRRVRRRCGSACGETTRPARRWRVARVRRRTPPRRDRSRPRPPTPRAPAARRG